MFSPSWKAFRKGFLKDNLFKTFPGPGNHLRKFMFPKHFKNYVLEILKLIFLGPKRLTFPFPVQKMESLIFDFRESLSFWSQESFSESQTFLSVEKNRPATYPAAISTAKMQRGRQRPTARCQKGLLAPLKIGGVRGPGADRWRERSL